ncbi:solute carrier family 22 member 4-like [Anarrhichthys ocellatus]|uniref:solute carrier family 22 member 4-like n=1 Tax=Anarrhichthys ocellatus TaxID=433405 RepID=UPI0012EDFE7E|nr:solute carrier family 22 member 4-like [Anarrhichthys ocellatus]
MTPFDHPQAKGLLSRARPSNDTEQCLDGSAFSTEGYTATIVSEWDLVCDNAWKVPFSTSLFFVGVLIGSFISGDLSDRFGRRPVFFSTMALLTVTPLIQATSVSWIMFCILNALRGLGYFNYFNYFKHMHFYWSQKSPCLYLFFNIFL